ncbi:MAG: SpoIIE family protein phosphatase [Pseudomonadota bacterium]
MSPGVGQPGLLPEDELAQEPQAPDLLDSVTALHSCQTSEELLDNLAHYLSTAGCSGHAVLLEQAGENHHWALCSSLPDIDARAGVVDLGRFDAYSAVPLLVNRQRLGTVLIDALAPAQADTIGTLLSHFAIALFRHQIDDERQRRHRLDAAKLGSLTQISGVLSELSLDKVLAKLMELAITTVGGEVGCIALADAPDAAVRVVTEWGFGQDMLDALRLTDGQSLVEVVARERLLSISRCAADFEEFEQVELLDALTTMVVVPLATHKGHPGCVLIANATALEDTDIELLRMITELSSSAIDNALLHQDTLDKEALRQQLEIAGNIQQALLPTDAPELEGAVIAGLNLSCDESGGDFFDHLALDEHNVTFVLGDATGHGIGAALIATTLRASLRALTGLTPQPGLDLADRLGELNTLAEEDLPDDKFMTLFFGQYDAASRTLNYASAGHEPPMLLYRAASQACEYLEATGLPLGMFAGMPYDNVEGLAIEAGDIMLVMTDGVTEAEKADGEQFGKERIEAFVRANAALAPRELIRALADHVFEYMDGHPQNDDITLLCLKADG